MQNSVENFVDFFNEYYRDNYDAEARFKLKAALEAWAEESTNVKHAQQLITERAKASSLASEGKL